MDESDLDSTIEPSKDVFDSTHLSDVIEVIEETDPDFTKSTVGCTSNKINNKSSQMFNGGGKIASSQKAHKSQISSSETTKSQAYVRIIEQPASKALRFRYECEGRCAGSIPGASSTPENKTYPEIQVEGYKGRAVVVVSCVMKDPPYAVHPHNLVGREGCKKGVCTLEIPPETMRIQFSNLGIQCVKKRDIESSLRQREEIRVDPFKQHYQHKNQPGSIDLNAVRLCFQVFIEGNVAGQITGSLAPVVSEIIYDKKAMSDLAIIKLSDCVSYVDGGRKDIILLCEKVAKEDIEIHFYELENGKKVWEAKADFQPTQVHKQHAIWFRTPRYHKLDVTEPVKVFIQLYRPSDQVTSAPLPFELLPLDAASDKRIKRKRLNQPFVNHLEQDRLPHNPQQLFNTSLLQEPIKVEPRDSTSPYNAAAFATSMYQGNSPNYVQSPAISPHYLTELAPTPSPENIYRQQPINILDIGGYQQFQQPHEVASNISWNIATPQTQMPEMPNNLGSLLDLDNPHISSGTLNNTINNMALSMDTADQLADIGNLSITDIQINNNNSDSLSNIILKATQNI